MAPQGEGAVLRRNGGGDGDVDPDRKLIGYDGQWYDVTAFARRHPGGDVIYKFAGRDATSAIDNFHPRRVVAKYFKHKKSVGEYDPNYDDFELEMRQLQRFLQEKGYYDSSGWWYVRKSCFVLSLLLLLLVTSHAGVAVWNHVTMVGSGLVLGLLWQQSGMMMHDAMHSQITRKRLVDERIGLFFGGVLFGISAHWWKGEHVTHHALTNVIDDATGELVDPQADEVCFAQDPSIFPVRARSLLSRLLVKIQALTFFPFTILLGRFAIIVDSMREERRPLVWASWLLHLAWQLAYFSAFRTWAQVSCVYLIGCAGEGVLHLQLLINHYTKPFVKLGQDQNQHHYRRTITSNLNITCSPRFDWFHGGLNFHHEHHCFPRLPRDRLRRVSAMVRERCRRHGVAYDEMPFGAAVRKLLAHMCRMQSQFRRFDIRN